MTQIVKRVLWIASGWAFLLLGVVGLFLPFVQGILFMMIGLIILSSEYVWAHRLLSRLRERFPRLAGVAERAKDKAAHWWHRDSRPEGA
jgi:uncharacterized membrane protein YbaN (DUF454 family)